MGDFTPEEKNIIAGENTRIIKALEKKVFIFDSSKADRRYFLTQIRAWLSNDKDYRNMTQMAYDIVWQRNDQGKTCKYMYFNEKVQRLYLDNKFYEWVKRVSTAIGQFIN